MSDNIPRILTELVQHKRQADEAIKRVLDRAKEVLDLASDAEIQMGATDFERMEDMQDLLAAYAARGGLRLHYGIVPPTEEGGVMRCPLITGNGPSSEDNLRFFAGAHGTIKELVDVLRLTAKINNATVAMLLVALGCEVAAGEE